MWIGFNPHSLPEWIYSNSKRTPPRIAILILILCISANLACLGLFGNADNNPVLKISAVRGAVADGPEHNDFGAEFV
jgi:hypothetical protein